MYFLDILLLEGERSRIKAIDRDNCPCKAIFHIDWGDWEGQFHHGSKLFLKEGLVKVSGKFHENGIVNRSTSSTFSSLVPKKDNSYYQGPWTVSFSTSLHKIIARAQFARVLEVLKGDMREILRKRMNMQDRNGRILVFQMEEWMKSCLSFVRFAVIMLKVRYRKCGFCRYYHEGDFGVFRRAGLIDGLGICQIRGKIFQPKGVSSLEVFRIISYPLESESLGVRFGTACKSLLVLLCCFKALSNFLSFPLHLILSIQKSPFCIKDVEGQHQILDSQVELCIFLEFPAFDILGEVQWLTTSLSHVFLLSLVFYISWGFS